MRQFKFQYFCSKLFSLTIAVFFTSILFSCMTMADYDFSTIDSNLSKGDYVSVKDELEKRQKTLYTKRDLLLSNLDSGMIYHYLGDYKSSNEFFSNSEKLFEIYSATSISQSIASFMANDLSMDYSGEDFENIYTNIFMSLNYLRMNNPEEAMVEVRRFDNKLKVLKSKYELEVEKANSSKNEESDVKIQKVSIKFSDSALARYISMLLYRAENDISNAEVDYKLLKSAFSSQKSLYNFSIPSSIREEIEDESIRFGKSKARLNVIGFYGKSPVKKEHITRIYHPYTDFWYKIALPYMENRPTQISRIEVTAKSKSTGETFSRSLEKIESIENIAIDTFQQHLSVITARALARSITRTITTTTADAIASKAHHEGNDGAALLFGLAGLAMKAHTEAVERADIRSSRYFPANAAVTGITLEPGEYDVTIKYYSSNRIIHSEQHSVSVKRGRINLIETKCLM